MASALLVEDDASSLSILRELVENEGFRVTGAMSAAAARAALAQEKPDVMLTDLLLPDGSGMDLVKEAVANNLQVVVITGHASVESAVEALRVGAADYLTKPLDIGRLKVILANVVRTRALREEIGNLRHELRKLGRFGPLVGVSEATGKVYDLIQRVAPTEATVLVVGESGTGKEMVAQAIHQLSRRRTGPFVPVNCGAMAPTLIESTLFGHEKGSFTGAERQHRGVFEQAAGGTLFLDEITEMPIELQARLLRVLESGELVRVGAEKPIEVDVRLLAATNRDPQQAVADGKLRDDLWYRINVFMINLPSLRERSGDVEVLARHFLQTLNEEAGTDKRWSERALERMAGYSWPGNVRELKNAVQRAYILAEHELTEDCLPTAITQAIPRPPTLEPTPDGTALQVRVGSTVAEVEQRLIVATLEHCGGNKQKTAELLGVSLKTLYNRLAQYKSERESV
ncbi:MAG TPA: sigma-54 dependent transcriptional regulator [Terriglobales bacterium]|nr:sigma-54 dependent transcriptional regulator [Terriglobales bacterium]